MWFTDDSRDLRYAVAGGTVSKQGSLLSQCRKPSGWLGRLGLWRMNAQHSKLTDWGLEHVAIGEADTILDIGCGGGRTVSKLAVIAKRGRVYGLDYSEDSVAVARRTNDRAIAASQVEILQGSVSHMPFVDNQFDLITAVETHFFWPDLPGDMREVFRVLKPGGSLLLIAEVYRGSATRTGRLADKYVALTGMTLLTVDEHRKLLEDTGLSKVQITEEKKRGWICATGRKL